YKSIADSIHKYIDFPENFYFDIIDTPEFQRLRRLEQLGGVSASYPSATHSRFIHSLGAFHIANRIGSSLQKKYPSKVTSSDIQLVSTTALIHDVGHGPFSHMFEDTIKLLCNNSNGNDCFTKYKAFIRHENITEQIVRSENSEIALILEREGFDRRKMANLVLGRSVNDKPFLNQIIASQLDADSLDYLMRDSMATGVSFGLYNLERLFAMLEISRDGDLVVREKGLQSTEQVVIALYMQFTRVYFHKTVRCWEYMMKLFIAQLLQKIEEDKNIHVLPFIKEFAENPHWETLIPLTDDIMYTQLHLSSRKETNDDFIRQLAGDILHRKLYKSIPLTEEMAQSVHENQDKINFIVRKNGYPTN
ncbi:MAG: HD domain-containing protein, partial [Candidatus Heimdallarchaeota archaeon]|nr:HD domain-containing protein [Candidatus Heimdallarchaeota archaeon]